MLLTSRQNKPRGLFGSFGQGMQQMPAEMAPQAPQPMIPQMTQNMGETAQAMPKKPGVNWGGVAADFIAGLAGREGPYLAQIQARKQQEYAAQQAQAQREASMQDWQAKEQWKRDNPDPINNDTVNDYNFIRQTSGEEAANQYLQGRYDPVVNIPLGDGRTYIGPRSGAPAAVNGMGGQAPIKPVGKLTPIGGASGNVGGGFQPIGLRGETITSTYRTPAHNKKVGGVPNSYHTRRGADGKPLARDSTPPPGMSMASYAALLRRQNPHLDVINEGDHVHMEPK